MIPGSKSLNPHELAHKGGGYGLWKCAARNNPLVSQNPLLKNRGYNMLKFILFLF